MKTRDPQDEQTVLNLRAYLARIGSNGGNANTPAQQKARRANAKKARAAKEQTTTERTQ